MGDRNRAPLGSEIFDRPGSRSQFGQETFVCDLIYRGQTGYYVDVGARCGVISSNTSLLDRLGWTGLCIEPEPTLFERLAEARPNATCVRKAASDRSGTAAFMSLVSGPAGRSGLLGTYRPDDLERMRRKPHEVITVPVAPLTQILDDACAPSFVHYLDIDVEGHEMAVLSGIDFARYRFGVIGVETRPGFPDHERIVSHLAATGYRPVARLGADTMFMAD